MKPATPKTELQPSTQLRKVVFGGSLILIIALSSLPALTVRAGDAKVVEEIVVRGFKIAMGKEDQGGILTIFHGEHFVLVDGQGRIRGYYVSDDEGLAKLVSDVASLG